jgi:hypothetical protein
MKRRRFLQTSTSLLAATAAARLSALTPPSISSALTPPDLLGFVGNRDYIRQLGLTYRTRFPDEANAASLCSMLDVDMSRLPDSRIRDQLDQLVLADFARGDTVLLDGWLLARTEARQCALCSLLDR